MSGRSRYVQMAATSAARPISEVGGTGTFVGVSGGICDSSAERGTSAWVRAKRTKHLTLISGDFEMAGQEFRYLR